jgi:hypothetical protein
MNTTTNAANDLPTTGYMTRIDIAFSFDRHGEKVAYRWSRWTGGGRWVEMFVAAAEEHVSNNGANVVSYKRGRRR